MPSAVSWCLLLMSGLCCLLPVSQETEASDPDYKFPEHPGCRNISDTLTGLFFSLYRKIAHRSKHSNILLSPLSIASAFGMLSLGTKGKTHTQIIRGLHFSPQDMPEARVHQCFQRVLLTLLHPDHLLQLTMGSSLFIDKSLKVANQFVQDVKELYYSRVISISFMDTEDARNHINKHVESETQGEIADLVKNLQKGTALALVNYISFHGKLHEGFLQEIIVEDHFQVHKRTIVVPMVRRLGRFYLQRYRRLSSWVLVQHYVGDAVAFFIMPDPGKMQQLEQRLTCEHLDTIQRHIAIRFVYLFFPKLSISGTHDLKRVMGTLGITSVFNNVADFSGATVEAPLKRSKVVHRAMVTLDEERTEGSEMMKVLWSSVPIFSFNRSFLVLIKDEFTNFPLFVGRVLDPTQQ